jgi:hypothetical protein
VVQEEPLCCGGEYLGDAVHNAAWLCKAALRDDRSERAEMGGQRSLVSLRRYRCDL